MAVKASPYLNPKCLNPTSSVSQSNPSRSRPPTNSQGSFFILFSILFVASECEWTGGCESSCCEAFLCWLAAGGMSFLTKLVTPIQAVVAVGVVMALSYRHIDEYNRHVQKYGPLGSMPRKRFAVEGPAPHPHRSEEQSPAQPEQGRLEE